MTTQPMHVVLVDDDEVDRRAIVRALKKAPMPVDVIELSTGAPCLETIRGKELDAILLDYRLPDIDGFDLMCSLRAAMQEKPAIIMVSNDESEEVAQRCIEAGAQDFLLKDEINPRHLIRAIMHARQRHSMDKKLRHLAQYDQLTNLPNRQHFEEILREAITRAMGQKTQLAILFLDLDDFKTVNDTLGHEAGDHMLRAVSERLAKVTGDGELVSRFGGDEFIFLQERFDCKDDLSNLGRRVISAFESPFDISERRLPITVSVGIATYPTSGTTAEGLIKSVDIATYRAKRGGRNMIQFHSAALDEEVHQRARVGWELRQALEERQLCLHYQPQVDLETGFIRGIETLVRWAHPKHGLLPPNSFLPAAEDLGLIEQIGEWVVEETCRVTSRWLKLRGPEAPPLSVAVNMSDSHIRSPSLPPLIDKALNETGLSPECLQIELTETALIQEPEKTAQILHELNSRGICISVDDFGVGYSSLQHLKLFPISTLKIDRKFVRESELDEESRRFLRAIVDFGKALDLTVIAEGVETSGQEAACRHAGCRYLQGFYHYPPLPEAEVEALLTSSFHH